ncbi:phosphate ABC transporter substrate-binding protein [Aromatoleum toluclasticum]|uniref:phosphate ABC transporter substrate-binding protein n=1 Tax=Aromatoleum toluclasticum TaxID=92003 RepID=UPI001D193053|nr:phosphate ABC transporter substrate-binding protein [Aromatoleum toluclasticum]MCC4118134.1 phosphate ABC transporter substrate-binding protein [Aromatoleum toluclasticum]
MLNFKRWRMLIAAVSSTLLVAACGQEAGARLVITGSSTVAPLATVVAQRFEAAHPEVKVDVQAGGSSRGIADVRQGLAELGMVSRALKPEESDLAATTIAQDGIAMIVHRDNAVSALTREQIIAIYTGGVRNWKDVGGADAPITVVNKAEGRSTLELFLSHFKLAAPAIRADVVIGDNQQGIKTVAGNPQAIGYVSIGTAEFEVEHGTPVRLLPLGGVAPTTASVAAGSFPLSRPLNLVHRGELSAIAREFLSFAGSVEVRDLVTSQYFVPPARR